MQRCKGSLGHLQEHLKALKKNCPKFHEHWNEIGGDIRKNIRFDIAKNVSRISVVSCFPVIYITIRVNDKGTVTITTPPTIEAGSIGTQVFNLLPHIAHLLRRTPYAGDPPLYGLPGPQTRCTPLEDSEILQLLVDNSEPPEQSPQPTCASQIGGVGDVVGSHLGERMSDGFHITFDCPHHRQQRQELIGDARTWEELDTPIWRKEEGEEEEWDAVEAYFAYLYCPLAGR
ncbi:hypothetical protein EV426DRAFT_709632 [Tirmania nivea]|nr:hypothetical protein EV426DRAFT_709632 [Tirmania nivea]